MKIIKIALVDDHPVFCEGIESLLNRERGFKVVMLAFSGRDLLHQLEISDDLPDIILLDLDMPILGGKDTLPILKEKYPDINVVILSFHADLNTVKEVLNLGAVGYLCKGGSIQGIIETINKVNELGYFLDSKVEEELRNIKINKNILPLKNEYEDHLLNSDEKAVLKLICQGKLTKQIAEIMCLSVKSIENHRSNLYKKSKSKNIVELVYYAIENRLDF